jgi:hemoglobin
MEFRITEFTAGKRPEVQLPSHEMYRILGDEGIRSLVSDHYDLLAQSPVKHLFPPDASGLERAKQNTSDFFIQICGGPMYFNRNRGRPMMYKRHLPHKITPKAREVWLDCYRQALQKQDLPEEVALSFWNYLNDFSIWMINAQ